MKVAVAVLVPSLAVISWLPAALGGMVKFVQQVPSSAAMVATGMVSSLLL
jgi:hypothetical protein